VYISITKLIGYSVSNIKIEYMLFVFVSRMCIYSQLQQQPGKEMHSVSVEIYVQALKSVPEIKWYKETDSTIVIEY